MSGYKGMLHYSEELKAEIRQAHEQGEGVRSLSRRYGISRYAIQSWCGLRPEVNLRQQAPLPRGRKPSKPRSLEQELRRLRMENEMMRDFLKECGRG